MKTADKSQTACATASSPTGRTNSRSWAAESRHNFSNLHIFLRELFQTCVLTRNVIQPKKKHYHKSVVNLLRSSTSELNETKYLVSNSSVVLMNFILRCCGFRLGRKLPADGESKLSLIEQFNSIKWRFERKFVFKSLFDQTSVFCVCS